MMMTGSGSDTGMMVTMTGDRDDGEGGSYFSEHGYDRINIPPGHYPPPGECRIWYPDRPAGHQPPPGDCSSVPPGAWVVRHPHDRPNHVQVTVYDSQRYNTVLTIREVEIDSGNTVRVRRDSGNTVRVSRAASVPVSLRWSGRNSCRPNRSRRRKTPALYR